MIGLFLAVGTSSAGVFTVCSIGCDATDLAAAIELANATAINDTIELHDPTVSLPSAVLVDNATLTIASALAGGARATVTVDASILLSNSATLRITDVDLSVIDSASFSVFDLSGQSTLELTHSAIDGPSGIGRAGLNTNLGMILHVDGGGSPDPVATFTDVDITGVDSDEKGGVAYVRRGSFTWFGGTGVDIEALGGGVLYAGQDASVTLEQLTLTGLIAVDDGSGRSDRGGALAHVLSTAQLILRDVDADAMTSDYRGGALRAFGSSVVQILDTAAPPQMRLGASVAPRAGHVQLGGSATLLIDGATLIDGQALQGTSSAGSIFVNVNATATVTLRNTRFEDNGLNGVAEAGALNLGPQDAVIDTCVFVGNRGVIAGAIFSEGAIDGVLGGFHEFTANTSGAFGGAIHSTGALGSLNVPFGATFQNNVATFDGGALWLDGAAAFITGSSFDGNTADHGGAIAAASSSLSLVDTDFDANKSAQSGGAIDADASVLDTSNIRFSNNEAGDPATSTELGGALALRGTWSGSNDVFSGNVAGSGGAVDLGDSTVTLDNALFENNVALERGGALCSTSADVTLTTSSFRTNTAQWGGAIDSTVAGAGSYDLADVDFISNQASEQGGAAFLNGNALTWTGGEVRANTSGDVGAGVYALGASGLGIAEVRFCANASGAPGSAIRVSGAPGVSLDVENNWFIENTGGAAIHIDGANFTLHNNTFLNNELAVFGGSTQPSSFANNLVVGQLTSPAVDVTAGVGEVNVTTNAWQHNPAPDGSAADGLPLGLPPLLLSNPPTGLCVPTQLIAAPSSPTWFSGNPTFGVHIGATLTGMGADVDGDQWIAEFDCPDSNPLQNPFTNGQIYYVDEDRDGLGDPLRSSPFCTIPPPGWVLDNTDCDDTDPLATVPLLWSPDLDADGFGTTDTADVMLSCQPILGRGPTTDCNDSDASINPEAAEQCNGLDNDCNTLVDDGLPEITGYRDLDQDGAGSDDPAHVVQACQLPANHVLNDATDCDDDDATVHPSASEICDGKDNDCDTVIDNGLATFAIYTDGDDDGYGVDEPSPLQDCIVATGFADRAGDCDDADDTVYDGAIETCDAKDNDCNGSVDDGVINSNYYRDSDQDGFGIGTPIQDCAAPPGYTIEPNDCDDLNQAIHPAAIEICDGVDNDCDQLVDDEDDDVAGAPTRYADLDFDNYGDDDEFPIVQCALPAYNTVGIGGDCDDSDPTINPTSPEACVDGIDNNCNGLIDAADPDFTEEEVVYWFDQDGDGVGTSGLTALACSGMQPPGFVSPVLGQDCDEGRLDINPQAPERCDGDDNDCDGFADDLDPDDVPIDALDWYPDEDSDGHAASGSLPVEACVAPPDAAAVPDDCDDTDASINPSAAERCTAEDDDCDGLIDADDPSLIGDFTAFEDTDADGFGAGIGVEVCELLQGFVTAGDDCEAENASIHPGAEELCDPIDHNCDGDAYDVAEQSWIAVYVDADSDGFYGTLLTFCDPADAPDDYRLATDVLDADIDCNDSLDTVYPGATERPDGPDLDCVPGVPGTPNSTLSSSGCSCDQRGGSMPLLWLFAGLFATRRRSHRVRQALATGDRIEGRSHL